MIISKCNDGKTIYKSWRENGEKKYALEDFRPYFYVKEEANEPREYKASKYITRDFEYIRGERVNIDNQPLKRVYVESSFDIKNRSIDGKIEVTYEISNPKTGKSSILIFQI